MDEPFFISRANVADYKSSRDLKAWTLNTSAKAKGAKFSRVTTNPATGEVVFEAWTEEHPDTGPPRWSRAED
jgi:hypothetical protein